MHDLWARRRGHYLHNTQQLQGTSIQALSGIRTGDLKRSQAYTLDRTATGIGRLIIIHGVNREDLQCVIINHFEISTGKFYSILIYDLNIERPAVEGDLFQFFRMALRRVSPVVFIQYELYNVLCSQNTTVLKSDT
jgi:hypothetical protein